MDSEAFGEYTLLTFLTTHIPLKANAWREYIDELYDRGIFDDTIVTNVFKMYIVPYSSESGTITFRPDRGGLIKIGDYKSDFSMRSCIYLIERVIGLLPIDLLTGLYGSNSDYNLWYGNVSYDYGSFVETLLGRLRADQIDLVILLLSRNLDALREWLSISPIPHDRFVVLVFYTMKLIDIEYAVDDIVEYIGNWDTNSFEPNVVYNTKSSIRKRERNERIETALLRYCASDPSSYRVIVTINETEPMRCFFLQQFTEIHPPGSYELSVEDSLDLMIDYGSRDIDGSTMCPYLSDDIRAYTPYNIWKFCEAKDFPTLNLWKSQFYSHMIACEDHKALLDLLEKHADELEEYRFSH